MQKNEKRDKGPTNAEKSITERGAVWGRGDRHGRRLESERTINTLQRRTQIDITRGTIWSPKR